MEYIHSRQSVYLSLVIIADGHFPLLDGPLHARDALFLEVAPVPLHHPVLRLQRLERPLLLVALLLSLATLQILISSGKKNKFGNFVVVVQLIHRLTQADVSCTTTYKLTYE